MEQRRFLLFFVLSMAVLWGWTKFFVPKNVPPKPVVQQDEKPGADVDPKGDDATDGAAKDPAGEDPAVGDDAVAAGKPGEGDQPAAIAGAAEDDDAGAVLPETNPRKSLQLGSLDAESGFFMQVTVTTRGAAIENIKLNGPRFRELKQPDLPLTLVGSTVKSPKTLATSVSVIDAQLEKFGTTLRDVDWKVEEEVSDDESNIVTAITLSYQSPDGTLQVKKRYALEQVEFKGSDLRAQRDNNSVGYQLHFDLTLTNLGDKNQDVTYELQGPMGLPLENAANTRKFRDLKIGFLDETGQLDAESLTSAGIAKDAAANELQEWKKPFRYAGVDIQYFATLLIPVADQLQDPYINVVKPILVEAHKNKAESEISLTLTSHEIALPVGQEETHSYLLYAGPKRESLLAPLGAEQVLDFGWFGVVSGLMLKLLTFLHNSWGVPYGFAIICLTILVRGCMYPLSRKQAAGAKKMKELQPKIAEIRKKYANDKEKLARAQMELFGKNNYNPLAGCLPLFLQFPIFIGLYQALNNAVDLRMAPFLWFDNLGAPDALFRMPFSLPFIGQDFNLLPILTCGLFVLQQKIMMPPPAPDDEQAKMQHKMMTYMSVFFGFLFYHMPAGLCVYFIASSLWGMGERKLLDLGKSEKKTEDEVAPPAVVQKKEPATAAKKSGNGLWGRLVASAEAATTQQAQIESSDSSKRGGGSKKKKKKSRQRR